MFTTKQELSIRKCELNAQDFKVYNEKRTISEFAKTKLQTSGSNMWFKPVM